MVRTGKLNNSYLLFGHHEAIRTPCKIASGWSLKAHCLFNNGRIYFLPGLRLESPNTRSPGCQLCLYVQGANICKQVINSFSVGIACLSTKHWQSPTIQISFYACIAIQTVSSAGIWPRWLTSLNLLYNEKSHRINMRRPARKRIFLADPQGINN